MAIGAAGKFIWDHQKEAGLFIDFIRQAYTYFSSSNTNTSNNDINTNTNSVDPAPDQDTVNQEFTPRLTRLDLPNRSIGNTNLDNTKVTEFSKLDFLNF
ncbi:MAG: hypothetical protein WCD44_00275 [Candidatus Babeliales bacterium]